MIEVIPAIIGHSFSEIELKIKQVEGLAGWVHLDIMDQAFAKTSGWRTPDDLKFLDGKVRVEAHLMIEKPEDTIREWSEVVDRLTVHYESTDHLDSILEFTQAASVELGVALLLNTKIDVLEPIINEIDVVQLMSIAEIGHHGAPFDEKVIEKVILLRERYPDVRIQLDGGINLKTARQVIEAGADNLVVGSAIWSSKDPTAALAKFQKLAAES